GPSRRPNNVEEFAAGATARYGKLQPAALARNFERGRNRPCRLLPRMPQDAWREVDVYRFRDCCQTSRNTCKRQSEESRELSCSRIAWTRLRRGAGAARRKKNSSRGVVSRQDARGWIADGERLCKCAQETSPPRARNVARGRCQGTGRRGVMGSFS